jgi:hypothetical protein
LVEVSLPVANGKRIKLTVNKVMAPALCLAFAEIEYWNRVEPWGNWLPKVLESWCIRFTSSSPNKKVLSTHAYAMAIDVDSTENVVGTAGTIPPWVVETFEQWGFIWGGRWKKYLDPMHFQYMGMK